MKYFICIMDGTSCIGIPAERTERIITASRAQAAVRETESQQAFISLPLLLRLKDSSAPHGLVLKAGSDALDDFKTVLLTPRIDIEMEIPEGEIHQLPEIFFSLLRYFRGVHISGKTLILILDPEKLAGSVQ